MKIIITFSILCGLFLTNSHSKNNWKQISGRGASSQSFFNQNEKAKVIWGYENGLWRVACYHRCTELTDKYLPLENLKDNVGYWVNFESVASTEDISTGLVGEWDITLKSSNPWDNTSAVLNVSNQYSTSLTGHPIIISELGVKGKDPVSKFEISNIQVIEDTLLQIDHMLYKEVPKTKEELTEALPDAIRAELVEITAKKQAFSRRYPYVPTTFDSQGYSWDERRGFYRRIKRDSNGNYITDENGRYIREDIPVIGRFITGEENEELNSRYQELIESYAVKPINDNNVGNHTFTLNQIDKNIRCKVNPTHIQIGMGIRHRSFYDRNSTQQKIEVNSLFYKNNESNGYSNLIVTDSLYSVSGHALEERMVRLEKLTGVKPEAVCEPNDDYYNLIPSFKSSYFNILKNESKRIILQVRDGVFLILKKK
ncbi:MAG: hypothetical protein KC646_10425 [Candidatus Cloacimonetes bacterium]|nr:hypothetical protein [Candidatus Cloacimonadota bacterium]